jgi:hypothetical protein
LYNTAKTNKMPLSLKLFTARPTDEKYYLVYDISEGKNFRKRVTTGLKIEPKYWDKSNNRVKASHPNSQILNEAVKKYRERLDTAISKWETGQFSRQQVVAFLKGESGINSIDEYIDTNIKNTRKDATYRDYRGAWRSVKQYNDYNVDEALPFSVVNYTFLDTFKRKAIAKGVTNASINSNLDKIRAIMNDAFDNGVIFEKFVLNKRLKLPKQKRQISIPTPEDFKGAITKVKTIYHWQSLAFYLLMFYTRGMYPADIVSLKVANLENKPLDRELDEWDEISGDLLRLCEVGHDYLIHRRHKTKNKSNDDMVIRVDTTLLNLIYFLKRSVIYTHYKRKPEIIPTLEDSMSIFVYDVDKDYQLHSNVWDSYKKHITRLLGHSFKSARKTFDTIAASLDISTTTRQILLGHNEDSMLWHYGDTNTDIIRERVEKAHIDILKSFDADALNKLLLDKLDEMNVVDYLKPNDSIVWLDEKAEWKHYKKLAKK